MNTPKAQRYVPTLPSVQEIPSPSHVSLTSSAETLASCCREIDPTTIPADILMKQQLLEQFNSPGKPVELEQEESYEEHSTSASSPASFPSKPTMAEEQVEDEMPANPKDYDGKMYSSVFASSAAAQSAMLDIRSDGDDREAGNAMAEQVSGSQSSSWNAGVGDEEKGGNTEAVIRGGEFMDATALPNAIGDAHGTSTVGKRASGEVRPPSSPLTERADVPAQSDCSVSSGNRDDSGNRNVVFSSRQLRPRIYKMCYKEPSMRLEH